MKRNNDNMLIAVAVIAVIVSVIGAGITYNSVMTFRNIITGRVTEGVVNLTVETNAALNFTTDSVEFGSGRIDDGESHATLDTSAGTVSNGNWTANSDGFVVENIGNVNISLSINASTPAEFIGGSSPTYAWNVTNSEADSCINSTELGVFNNFSGEYQSICDIFKSDNNNDEIRIDLLIAIPTDSKTGLLQDTIYTQFSAV